MTLAKLEPKIVPRTRHRIEEPGWLRHKTIAVASQHSASIDDPVHNDHATSVTSCSLAQDPEDNLARHIAAGYALIASHPLCPVSLSATPERFCAIAWD